MVAEVLQALGPRPGGRYVDGTLGLAGHAAAILAASAPTGWLVVCDRDGLAGSIVRERESRKAGFETTQDLAEWVELLAPRRGKKAHPATKVFQALRVAVNDEIGSLERGLTGALGILKPGARLAVLTFNS